MVTAQAIVQYRVLDPVAFLFAARSVDATLAAVAESALTRALAGHSIDDVLTTGRAEVAERMLRAVQERADLQGLGVSIRAVRLGRVAPPVPVAPAFADAARARSDRRQAVTRAEEYRDRALADARSQAREIADRAAGQFDRLVQGARGDADRFTKVLAESRKDLAATRRRLYLEALAELLPRFARKVVVAPGHDLDISLFTEGGPEERNRRLRGARRWIAGGETLGLVSFGGAGADMKRIIAGLLTVALMGVLLWSGRNRPAGTGRAGPSRAGQQCARPGRGAAG